jgi:poly-beta-1,6-N-acetyl-D-glucosamine synthase
MSDALLWILATLAAPALLLGVVELGYYPLALIFEGRRSREPVFATDRPLVSVVVPAYNEERVIANCVESVLADRYPHKEVILVDDGSSDRTLEIMRRFEADPRVRVVSQANAGKAAALNAGIARSAGEVLLFVDADGIFTPGTTSELLKGFDRPDVGAVCGNDEPVNLDRHQTRLLALLTHGTAFVRRALAQVGCLTIVSGNCGAFRRAAIEQVGDFMPGFVGEDLELTWRVHLAGWRVAFRPRAIVYAEVPSTVRALWKQRVRWTRGHLQTVRLHSGSLFRPRFGRVSTYLPINAFAMLVVPVLQLAALVLITALIALGASPVSGSLLGLLAFFGLIHGLAAIGFAIALDRAWADLRLLYMAPAWILFSLMMSLVTARAWILELRRRPAEWDKLARTGVVSRRELGWTEA